MVISWSWFRERSGVLSVQIVHKVEWDRVAELMMIKFGESGHPVFRATSPLSRGMLQSKSGGQGRWKIVDTLLCRFGND